MAKTYRNSGEILAQRALEPDGEPRRDAQGKGHVQTFPAQEQPRRLIYSGTMPVPPEIGTPVGASLPLRNRKITRRRVSPFNIILLLMGLAAAIVLYISNIIAVDQLMNDIHKNQRRLQEILNDQELLRAKINQTSSLERIRKRAEEELGLRNPRTAPNWLQIDPEKVRELEQATVKR